tara:strand:+ start:2739 stop:2951 length:213 start_codon:yes stop_codon:yes gene_type:complete
METKKDLESRLNSLRASYVSINDIADEIWSYHPSNPDFINPIRVYEELVLKLKGLEEKISKLEMQINSLN